MLQYLGTRRVSLWYTGVIHRSSLWLLPDVAPHHLAGKPWEAPLEDSPIGTIGIGISLPFFFFENGDR